MSEEKAAVVAFLREAITKSGWTAYTLAKKVGVASTTISRPLFSEDYPYVPKLATLARIAALTGAELPVAIRPKAWENERLDIGRSSAAIPVLGDVRRGAWIALTDGPPTDWLHMEIPEYAGTSLFALRVVGPAEGADYTDGMIIVVCPPDEAGLHHGDCAVVRRFDGAGRAETTLRVVERDGGGKGRLKPPADGHDGHDGAGEFAVIGVVVGRYSAAVRGRGPLLTL